MSSTICSICKKDYKYPSKLKIHINSVYGCFNTEASTVNRVPLVLTNNTYTATATATATDTDIDTAINTIIPTIPSTSTNSNNETSNTFSCNKCNKLFKCKFSLTRHTNNVRCISVNNITNNTTNNNTTNGDVNNGTINDNRQITNITNNNIIIQHINPFGHENTDFLSNQEKLNILRSGHTACIKILKIVYNRNENKNFYKVNKKSSTITYLKDTVNTNPSINTSNTSPTITSNNNPNIIDINNNNDSSSLIDVFQHREFRKEIFNNSTTLLYSIMLDCKNDLCFEEQLSLMDNITIIKNDVYNEIFNNSLSNLRREIGELILDTETKNEINWGIENVISNEIENNNDTNKKKILNYVKQINNEPIVKDIFTSQIIKEKKKRKTIQKELNDTSLITDDINTKHGKLEYGKLANQLIVTHYPNTKFAKDLIEREKKEETLVRTNNTLGKLNAYNDMKRNRENNINNILRHQHNIEKLKELSEE